MLPFCSGYSSSSLKIGFQRRNKPELSYYFPKKRAGVTYSCSVALKSAGVDLDICNQSINCPSVLEVVCGAPDMEESSGKRMELKSSA
jgi:hypothetical protein